MSYGPGVYRKQGGNELVVASTTSGPNKGFVTLELASGGIRYPAEDLGTADVATSLADHGLSTLAASTTGPTYTLSGPTAAGLLKVIAITSNTSSGTANVNTSSTGVSVTSSGDNQLQFNAIADRVTMISQSTTGWIICGNVGSVATGTQTT